MSIDKFIQWAQASVKANVPAWKWIVPKDSLVEQISSKIPLGSIIPPGLHDAFVYLVKADSSEDWAGLVTACQKHIQHANGEYTRTSHSKEVFEMLFILGLRFDEYDNQIKTIVNDWRSCNLGWHLYRENPPPQIALLFGKYLGNQLNTFTPNPGQPNVVNFASGLRVYWNNRNKDNANVILGLLEEYNKWDSVWDLAADSNNKLLADIISLALNDEKANTLFRTNNALRKIGICFDLFGDDNTEPIDLLVKALIRHSSLENEVIKDSELNIIESSEELYHVVELSSNSQLITHLADKVRGQPKEVWSDALKKDTYLTSLAVAVKQKDSGFGLDNDYADALIDFVKSTARGRDKLTDWQKSSWHKLISLMGDAFQLQYKGDLTQFMMDEHNEVSNEFIELNSKYFDYGKMRQNVEGIQNMLRNAINAKDFPRLKWLNESVLFPDKGKQFKQQRHFSEIVKNPLNSLFQDQQDNAAHVTLIKELAANLQVELIEAAREEDNDGLAKILISSKWRLFFNPNKNPAASKIMRFAKEGIIVEGENNNESSWRIQNDLLELVDSAGQVHSRFKYDSKNNRFDHTNDPDTGSIVKHSIRDQYMISEA